MKRITAIFSALLVVLMTSSPVTAAMRLSTGLQNLMAGINTEMVTYGAMTLNDDVQTNWTEVTSTMLGAVTKDAQVCMSLSTAGYASTPITTKIGHYYKLTYQFDNEDATGVASVRVGTAADGAQNFDSGSLATTTGSWTTAYAAFRATATTTYITLKNSGASIKYFDNVSVSTLANSIQNAFHLGDIEIYSGTQPADPDAAPTGTLLVTINNGGTGITFGDAVDGYLSKTSGETWTGVGVVSGTAGWFRIRAAGDGGALSTTDARIDGAVGTSGSDLNFTSLTFTIGATQTISDFHPTVNMQ